MDDVSEQLDNELWDENNDIEEGSDKEDKQEPEERKEVDLTDKDL